MQFLKEIVRYKDEPLLDNKMKVSILWMQMQKYFCFMKNGVKSKIGKL